MTFRSKALLLYSRAWTWSFLLDDDSTLGKDNHSLIIRLEERFQFSSEELTMARTRSKKACNL